MPAPVTHCIANDLAELECREIELAEGITGFVVRIDNQFYAYRNRCPHLGIELNWMPGQFLDADKCFIQCSTHGALFTPEDGHCIAGPCAGDQLEHWGVQQQGDTLLITAQL